MIVADTDVLIDGLRGREPARTKLAEAIRAGSLQTTTVTVFELLSGARKPPERAKVEALLAGVPALPLDEEAAGAAADVYRDLASRGKPIGMADCLIAGTCLANSAKLLTRNVRHFGRVPSLKLESME